MNNAKYSINKKITKIILYFALFFKKISKFELDHHLDIKRSSLGFLVAIPDQDGGTSTRYFYGENINIKSDQIGKVLC